MSRSAGNGSERPAAAPDAVPTEQGSSVAALSDSPSASGPQRPLLTVVRGEPTPEQLAALIAVVGARASRGGADEEPPVRSLWAAPQLRAPLSPGPGAWRASALPR